MVYNPSLAKFKTKMKETQEQLRHNVHQALLAAAEEVAENIRAAAPKQEGTLAASVRTQDVSRITRANARYAVRIKAGGPTTLKRSFKSGEIYDYAVAVEFGTRKMQAEPFFYNTFRRYNSTWPEKAAETLAETIAANQEILGKRSSDSTHRTGGTFRKVEIGKLSRG